MEYYIALSVVFILGFKVTDQWIEIKRLRDRCKKLDQLTEIIINAPYTNKKDGEE